MKNDATIEEKQGFLRETILDKGYDVNEFIQFLIDKKGEEAADVSNWSMHDLQMVVHEFIRLNGGGVEEKEEVQPEVENNKPYHEEEPAPQPVIENQEVKPKVEEVKKNTKKISMFDVMPSNKPKSEPPKPQVKIEKANVIREKDIKPEIKKTEPQIKNVNHNNEAKPNLNITKGSKSVNTTNNKASLPISGGESDYGIIIPETKKCKSTDKTQLGKLDNIEITVSNPEKKETGFIKKTHVSYLITTLPLNFKVRRRFSELSWFRQALINLFPTNLIPAIPRKSKFGADTLADAFIQKRLRAFQRFLNYLVKDPNIKDSQILLDFLFIESENDLNNKKKVYENVKNFTEVHDFKSKEEKVNLLISSQKENYLENIKDNVNININILKKLNNSFKLLFNEMKAVVSRMEEISNYWNQAHKASLKYFDSNTTCESFKQLSNLFKTWSQIIKEQNTIVNVDIREHFKFIRKNFAAYKDLGNSVEPMKASYQKLSKNLMTKKDELYKKGEANPDTRSKSDFGVVNNNKVKALQSMLPKETNVAINAKEMYGLYLNRALSEYERMRALNGEWNKQVVVENVNKLMNILSKFHLCVGEINGGMDSATVNNSNDGKCRNMRIPLDETFLK